MKSHFLKHGIYIYAPLYNITDKVVQQITKKKEYNLRHYFFVFQ